jgi:hypothetical protein
VLNSRIADWGDFEERCGFQARTCSISLLAPSTASEIILVLTSKTNIALDNALVNNFVAKVARPEEYHLSNVATGVLSLADFVQQQGVHHVAKRA